MIRAAVLGKPIAHSLSPLVHGVIYRELGLDYSYERIELDQDEAKAFLPEALRLKKSELGTWSGFSLTMPLKEVGFELDLPIDAEARAAYSINTITSEGCFNTDISGLRRVIRNEKINANEAVILGNGATSRSVLLALDVLPSLKRIDIYRRSESRDSLLPRGLNVESFVHPIADLGLRHLGEDVLLISTIPATAQHEVSERLAGFEGTLIDISYSPWPSLLAGVVSGRIVSGLPMLVAQAVDQARIFSGLSFDEEEMYRVALLSTVRSLSTSI